MTQMRQSYALLSETVIRSLHLESPHAMEHWSQRSYAISIHFKMPALPVYLGTAALSRRASESVTKRRGRKRIIPDLRFCYNELTAVIHLIMRNLTFGTFSTDRPKATGPTSSSSLCLVCVHEARPSQPAELIDFLLPSIVHPGRRSDYGRHTARARGSWTEEGRWEGGRELARLRAELSSGPLEGKILNIYWIIYVCFISPPPPCVSAPPQKYAGPVSSRPNQTLPGNIEEMRSEGTEQCDLKTAS